MKILFLCTAHNSLSQRLFLTLKKDHTISVEYALSERVMIEAVELFQPDLILCPFLTSRVPREVYTKYLTLIVHPGPPGDAGPSALDWLLMGDDGSLADASQLLQKPSLSPSGRSHWGVTVLQAVEAFDAGPVWAFEQFPIDIDAPEVTKSTLYRKQVTQAAVTAVLAAVDRVYVAAAVTTIPLEKPGLISHEVAISESPPSPPETDELHPPSKPILVSTDGIGHTGSIPPTLVANPWYRAASVTLRLPFQGGSTHDRPLLKAAQRDFDIQTSTAREISRRIRAADSQPGCLSKLFGGVGLYIYGGTIEERPDLLAGSHGETKPGQIIACRDEAVCVATCDGKGIWITHVRRTKRKTDAMLWPKVPAVSGLRKLGLLDNATLATALSPQATDNWSRAAHSTHQEIWVDFATYPSNGRRVAFVYSEFYNGAMSTEQCSRLIEALEFVAATHVVERPLSAVVLMGGDSYFSNGIALNVIEAAGASDYNELHDEGPAAAESWRNINRIDDVVHMVLGELSGRRGIATVAALRGNCAAGGVAMAACCDFVIAGADTVLNPAYRALGLYGSEYHSLGYPGRCGPDGARRLLRDMLPLSPYEAKAMGLVDDVLQGSGSLLDSNIRSHVEAMVCSSDFSSREIAWKSRVDVTPAGLAAARAQELGEMANDFWSARSVRYHSRRRAFVRKIKPQNTPLRFATHRRQPGGEGPVAQDEEESDEFDDVAAFEKRAVQKLVEQRLVDLKNHEAEYPKTLGPNGEKPQGDLGPIFSCYYGTTV